MKRFVKRRLLSGTMRTTSLLRRSLLDVGLIIVALCTLGVLHPRAAAAQDAAPIAFRPFRFVLYGDTRDGHDVHRQIVALIQQQKPDLVLSTGDLVKDGRQPDLWKIYDEITGDLRAKLPVYTARGNHDLGGTFYEDRVISPTNSGNKLWYSFNKEGCHFVALCVDENTDYSRESPQYKWLIKDLETSASHARSTFVFFHVPPYSNGEHGSDADVQKTLCPVFTRYKVRAVFNGHDHIYYHTTRDGIPYIVSGGGGAPLYKTHPDETIAGDKWESVHNIVVFDVTTTSINANALRMDGTSIERFSIKSN